jgi:hypothetical protein
MNEKRISYSAKENKDLEKRSGAVVPKGLVVAVGGNEDKEHNLFVLRTIVALIENPSFSYRTSMLSRPSRRILRAHR